MKKLIENLRFYLYYSYYRTLVRHGITLTKDRIRSGIVRPLILSFIGNRQSYTTSSIIKMSSSFKPKQITYFVSFPYKQFYDDLDKDKVVWYHNKQDFYDKLKTVSTPYVVVDMYGIDQEEFRQEVQANCSSNIKGVFHFSTAGYK